MNVLARPWDASASNFIILAYKIGMQTSSILEVFRHLGYECNLEQIKYYEYIRPWDARASNFVITSWELGMHAELISRALQQHQYQYNLELVEQIIDNAGYMVWLPS